MPTDMRVYMADRRRKRRQTLIDLAGGACARCGAVESLEFDHIDPKTKSFVLSGCALDKSWTRVLEEFKKCQLLCNPCHVRKSREHDWYVVDHGQGTVGKRNCRCSLCKPLKNVYRNRYRATSFRVSRSSAANGNPE